MLDDCADDLKFGLRLIRKHPLLSAATIVTFTLGIGLDAGVFTVLDGLLFRPRVAHDPATFVELTIAVTDAGERAPAVPLASLQDYEAVSRATTLGAVAAWTPTHASIGDSLADQFVPLLVSCNFFSVYGPDQPMLGRLLRAGDCARADGPPVVVIGEDLWRKALAARPDVVGSVLQLNRVPFTIVGVMPSGYAGQLRGPIWIPYTSAAMFFGGRDVFREPSAPWLLGIVGRLRPGATRASAASELAVVARELDRSSTNRRTTIEVTPGAMIDTPLVRGVAAWLVPLVMAALSLVLLIACANVAMLLMSRSAARQNEMAVRISLGASRARLLRMLVTESVLLAAIALPPSLAVAYATPMVFRSLIPHLPFYPFAIDGVVVAYLAAAGLFAGIAAGVAPALESLKKDVNAALHGHESLPGALGWRARDLLMAVQIGVSLVLLVGAGLFLHAELRMLSASPGYEIDHVMVVTPRVMIPPYTPQSASTLLDSFADRVRAVPGVSGIGYVRGSADESDSRAQTTTMTAVATAVTATPATSAVSSQYFRTLRIPIVAGAAFGDDAASAKLVVVSESLARNLWPGRTPIGDAARINGADVVVAGIARDVVSPTSGAGERTVYRPTGAIRAGDAMYVAFDGEQAGTAQAIREALAALDPGAAAQPQTIAAIRREQAAKFMPIVEMVMGLGVVALVLGVAGIYGVVSFAVERRTKEMGIRIALGAQKADIIRLVLASGALPAATGAGCGAALALLGSRTLARVLANSPVRIDAWDPTVFGGVTLLLAVASIAAMAAPARRAASEDPVHALRQS